MFCANFLSPPTKYIVLAMFLFNIPFNVCAIFCCMDGQIFFWIILDSILGDFQFIFFKYKNFATTIPVAKAFEYSWLFYWNKFLETKLLEHSLCAFLTSALSNVEQIGFINSCSTKKAQQRFYIWLFLKLVYNKKPRLTFVLQFHWAKKAIEYR